MPPDFLFLGDKRIRRLGVRKARVQQYIETPRVERGVAGLGGSIAGGRTAGAPRGAAENGDVEQEAGERCGEIRRRSDNSPSQRRQREANALSLHNAD
jgi:hypothetical protein